MGKLADTANSESQSHQLEITTVTTAGPVLAWNANPEPDIVGYRLKYGTSSGVYSQILDVGNVTTATVPNLAPGTNYFFVLTAYNAFMESQPSNEVMWIAVTPTPTATPSPSPRQSPTPTPRPSPTPATPTPTPTPTPPQISISGNILTCAGLGLPSATITLTTMPPMTAVSDIAGNYNFNGIVPGGTYVATTAIPGLTPGNPSINIVDVLAAQRHFLGIVPLTGCQFLAGDVNADTLINTFDVVAIQRFFNAYTTATANVGKYRFIPASRAYLSINTNQTGQDYQALVFGDIIP